MVLRWVVLYRCWFFSSVVSFFVRGSGISTSFFVTSLYIDAAPLGGAAILQCECGLLEYKKEKKKKKWILVHTRSFCSRVLFFLSDQILIFGLCLSREGSSIVMVQSIPSSN